MMKIRIKRIIKLTSVVFCVLIIIIVRFMLKKTVTNTRDYYFEDKKISVAYELESIYNPIIHEYNIIGEITIVGFQFIVYARQQHLLFRKNNIKQNLRIEGSLKHHFLFTETPILCLINQSKGSFT